MDLRIFQGPAGSNTAWGCGSKGSPGLTLSYSARDQIAQQLLRLQRHGATWVEPQRRRIVVWTFMNHDARNLLILMSNCIIKVN
jgi:hypothetical protein